MLVSPETGPDRRVKRSRAFAASLRHELTQHVLRSRLLHSFLNLGRGVAHQGDLL